MRKKVYGRAAGRKHREERAYSYRVGLEFIRQSK